MMNRDEAKRRFDAAIESATRAYEKRLKLIDEETPKQAIAREKREKTRAERGSMLERLAREDAESKKHWAGMVGKILPMLRSGLTLREIADHFGVKGQQAALASREAYRRERVQSPTELDDLSSSAARLLQHAFPKLQLGDPYFSADDKKALFKEIQANGIPLEKFKECYWGTTGLPFMDLDEWARRHGVPFIALSLPSDAKPQP